MNIIHNSGIISTGNNAQNSVNNSSQSPLEVDWAKLEEELINIKGTNDLESIKSFAEEASIYTKAKNYNGLVKCIKELGKAGLEIISKTSSVVLAEVIKKSIGM